MRNPLQSKTHSPVSLVEDLTALFTMSFFDINSERSSGKADLTISVSTLLMQLSTNDEATIGFCIAVLATEMSQCTSLLKLFLKMIRQLSEQELHQHTAVFFQSLMNINSSSTTMEKATCQTLTLQFKNLATCLHLFKSACLTSNPKDITNSITKAYRLINQCGYDELVLIKHVTESLLNSTEERTLFLRNANFHDLDGLENRILCLINACKQQYQDVTNANIRVITMQFESLYDQIKSQVLRSELANFEASTTTPRRLPSLFLEAPGEPHPGTDTDIFNITLSL